VRPHFVSRLLYNSPLRLHVRSPSATMSHRYDGTTMGPLSTRPPSPLVPLSSHPSPFHWTTSQSRGSSLVTAVANKNLDDVMCIPALWDVEAVCNRITLTPSSFSCSTTPLLLAFAFSFSLLIVIVFPLSSTYPVYPHSVAAKAPWDRVDV
jgi:hypothetical protein